LKVIAKGEEDVSAGRLTDQDVLFDRIETVLKTQHPAISLSTHDATKKTSFSPASSGEIQDSPKRNH